MGTRANTDVTAGARSVMEYCKALQSRSGMTATDFAAKCGFSRNYWFVRARFDAPLTVSDCERIAKTCGMTLRQLFANALAAQEEKRTAETLNKLQRGDVALAARPSMERRGRITTSLPDLPIDRRMTYGAMRRAIVGLPVTVSSAILPNGLWGCYDASNSVILIDRRLTYTAKRCVLTHELLHWKHGDDGCSNNRSKQERRARTQTALTLVDPAELALLEHMYDDDLWSIADELDVTMQVLEDYRHTLAA